MRVLLLVFALHNGWKMQQNFSFSLLNCKVPARVSQARLLGGVLQRIILRFDCVFFLSDEMT